MKKSITIYIENNNFQEIKNLEKYGFEIAGNLIPFKSGFLQTMTITENNLIVSLRRICLSKENIFLKMVERLEFDKQMNKTALLIQLNQKTVVSLNLWCKFNEREPSFVNKHLSLNEISDSLRFYYDSNNYLFISDIIEVEIINS